MPTREFAARLDIARDLCCYAQTNLASAHFRKGQHTIASIRLIGPGRFPLSNSLNRLAEVTIPLHGIHSQIQMSIKKEHARKFTQATWKGQCECDSTKKVSNENSFLATIIHGKDMNKNLTPIIHICMDSKRINFN
jgi:hypothetical protein